LLQLVSAPRHGAASLQQDGAQLVEQRRSSAHQPIAGTMQRLDVELRLALQVDKSHCWARCGLGDPFGTQRFASVDLALREVGFAGVHVSNQNWSGL
jgi:hypothetical protein